MITFNRIIFLRISTFILLLITSTSAYSQTTLSSGDIVITAIDCDGKTFRFVPLVDLQAGTEIYFTDSGWMGSKFRANEGAVKYTAPDTGITAGKNIQYTTDAPNFVEVVDNSIGTNGFKLSTSGDQIIIFQGSTLSPKFIFAVQSNSTSWQTTATDSHTSGLPLGLKNGSTAIAYGAGPESDSEYDNIWYNCSTTNGSKSEILTAVTDQNNWIGNNSNYTPCTYNFYQSDSLSMIPIKKFIHEIQGSGPRVDNAGTLVSVDAVVIGDFQKENELKGFFIQEETTDEDGDPLTSEGIFVYCDACYDDVNEGDLVNVVGISSEYNNASQIDASITEASVRHISSSNIELITPAQISLPASNSTKSSKTFESVESMLVEFTQKLVVTEHHLLGRYGQLTLSPNEKQILYTQHNLPDSTGYAKHVIEREKSRIILDDNNNSENIDPIYYPLNGGFSTDNTIRGGSSIENLKGIMHWSYAGSPKTDAWRIRPLISTPPSFVDTNPRKSVYNNPSDLKIASFNVLNYFNGNGNGNGGDFPTSRGAHSQAEFLRQTDKIVNALIEIDADIVGLIELENDYTFGISSSIASLVNALNMVLGDNIYSYVNPNKNIGEDQITNGFIYKVSSVDLYTPVQILDTPEFLDPYNLKSPKNRPAVAQTFEIIDKSNIGYNERFTVVVNHLKSKGRPCENDADDDQVTGQGNCNGTRTAAAKELVNWLSTDPTSSIDADFLIIGDLNAYALEDPITTITNSGYTNLLTLHNPDTYSYVYNGEWGTLDHALSNKSFASQISNVTAWHINSDEIVLLDYNDSIQDQGEKPYHVKPSQNTLYAPNQYRSSDHDPIIIYLSYSSK